MMESHHISRKSKEQTIIEQDKIIDSHNREVGYLKQRICALEKRIATLTGKKPKENPKIDHNLIDSGKTIIFEIKRLGGGYMRRVEVNMRNNLDQLEEAAINSNKFEDGHLYGFDLCPGSGHSSIATFMPAEGGTDDSYDTARTTIKMLMKEHMRIGGSIKMTYDYGDCHEFSVVPVMVGKYDKTKSYPVLIAESGEGDWSGDND